MLLGRGLCDVPIPPPEEPCRLWCVSEYDQVEKNLGTPCEYVEEGRTAKRKIFKKCQFRIPEYLQFIVVTQLGNLTMTRSFS
jgi:hypothetical protein